MRATLEPIAWNPAGTPFIWVVRVHADPDPAMDTILYVGSGTAIADDRRRVTLKGFTMPGFNVAAWKAVTSAFRDVGLTTLLYDRRNIGEHRSFSIPL
jgi:hypothetical protein